MAILPPNQSTSTFAAPWLMTAVLGQCALGALCWHMCARAPLIGALASVLLAASVAGARLAPAAATRIAWALAGIVTAALAAYATERSRRLEFMRCVAGYDGLRRARTG